MQRHLCVPCVFWCMLVVPACIRYMWCTVKPSCKAQWKGEEGKADRGRGGKTTSGSGQAWSLASPREQWRTGKNGENWLQNHLWCPNDPHSYGIDDDDGDDDGVLSAQWMGSFLSLRHLFVHRSFDIPVFALVCFSVLYALGSVEKKRSQTSLLLLFKRKGP